MRLLLNLRKRFGSNAGVAHIQNAAENGVLKAFTKVENIADELRRWADYIKNTDPNVQIIAMAMHHLDEFIGKQRDGPIKNDLLSVYTSKLEAFGRDPTNEAEEMLKKLQDELVKVGSTQQTHTAIRGIGSSSRTPTVNFAGQEAAPCFWHFKEGFTCRYGDKCTKSHKKRDFDKWIKDSDNKKMFDAFGTGARRGGGKGDKGGRGGGKPVSVAVKTRLPRRPGGEVQASIKVSLKEVGAQGALPSVSL